MKKLDDFVYYRESLHKGRKIKKSNLNEFSRGRGKETVNIGRVELPVMKKSGSEKISLE